jgi:predicted ferric reductase
VGVTLYSKMKYNRWKLSHEFLGATFMFAVLHIFLVRNQAARDYIFEGYYGFAMAVSLIGILAFIYSLLLKNRLAKEAIYTIESITKSKDVHQITMVPEGKQLSYKSGQFLFVRFYNERLSREPHPFSITSKSNDPEITIMVKNLGDFTSSMGVLKEGDRVALEGPYGRFSMARDRRRDQVWVAGGIGITPFLGMAEDLGKGSADKHVDLYYSVKTEDELVGMNTLRTVERNNKRFRLITWVSEKAGRLTLESIRKHSGDLRGKEYYLCGPAGLKNAISDSLIAAGIPKDHIHEEEFSFR